MPLQKEYEMTQISLKNFEILKNTYGTPSFIELASTSDGFYIGMFWEKNTDEDEDVEEFAHIFTGLSWGYGGEGCMGLEKVLKACNAPYTIKDIASWDQDNFLKTIVL